MLGTTTLTAGPAPCAAHLSLQPSVCTVITFPQASASVSRGSVCLVLCRGRSLRSQHWSLAGLFLLFIYSESTWVPLVTCAWRPIADMGPPDAYHAPARLMGPFLRAPRAGQSKSCGTTTLHDAPHVQQCVSAISTQCTALSGPQLALSSCMASSRSSHWDRHRVRGISIAPCQ